MSDASAGLDIVVFCCHYCAYAAADLAGVLRMHYPADLKIIEIPCSGRFEVLEALHALEAGADGVLVAGCLEGDCHFQAGNLNARRRVEHARKLIAQIGLEPDRLAMAHMSSAMGARFAETAREFSRLIHDLGPSPLR